MDFPGFLLMNVSIFLLGILLGISWYCFRVFSYNFRVLELMIDCHFCWDSWRKRCGYFSRTFAGIPPTFLEILSEILTGIDSEILIGSPPMVLLVVTSGIYSGIPLGMPLEISSDIAIQIHSVISQRTYPGIPV